MTRKFSSGASSTTEKPRYDLIPLSALRRLANRFGYGATKHGEKNYQQGFDDGEFIRDRRNHLIEHIWKYVSGDRSIDHLGAILCNAAILAELEELAGEIVPPQNIGITLPLSVTIPVESDQNQPYLKGPF